jgi:hypothetical protein
MDYSIIQVVSHPISMLCDCDGQLRSLLDSLVHAEDACIFEYDSVYTITQETIYRKAMDKEFHNKFLSERSKYKFVREEAKAIGYGRSGHSHFLLEASPKTPCANPQSQV